MEIEYEEECSERGLLYFIKKHKKAVIILSAVLIFIVIIFYFWSKALVPESWSRFDSERIRFIEDKYKISLDNAKPVRYKVVSIAQDSESMFYFEVDDYKKFMENDFHGKAVMKSNESSDGSNAEYVCRLDEVYCCTIYFTKKGDKYEGFINRYGWRENTAESIQPSSEGYVIYRAE